MGQKEGRYDRQARLGRLEHILCQNPQGLTVRELAEKCEVCTRTTRRDLRALEEGMKVPIWQAGPRWGVDSDSYLPPVRFSSMEALTILLAIRLYQRLDRDCNQEMLDTFTKLNSVLPAGFQKQVNSTLDRISHRHPDTRYSRVLRDLCQAMLEGRKCRITYWTMGDPAPAERVIAPYFIEPVAQEHANYVIGRCDKAGQVRTFKLDRIRRSVLLDETYTIPDSFSIDKYLSNAWSIFTPPAGQSVRNVTLKFAPEVARYMEEGQYHHSQTVARQDDGSVMVNLRLADTPDFIGWILGWGDHVEVLEPPSLRRLIKKKAEAVAAKYG
ncbi:helix-turn-helix type 11 domain protein [Dehalogenimonas lykanthroporepellens BL-DC-9]|nr:helix-turn-helix type 11 domain protein [Dehalogenimonas lykanthroporepellens BL-DC-9]